MYTQYTCMMTWWLKSNNQDGECISEIPRGEIDNVAKETEF
jgi:hypothetical protein